MAEGSTADNKDRLKVELDLDDAPFLDDEPEEESKPASAAAKAPDSAEPELPAGPAPEKFAGKRKKLIIAGAGGVLLILLALAAYFFFFPGREESPPPPLPEPKVETPAVPSPPPAQEYLMQWEPFWVELQDTEGAPRFLSLRITTPTTNPVVFAEMNGKKLLLRDALFYYLRNQPIIALSDEAKATALKSDLLTVINEHLASGKISEILIQEYLLQ